MTDFTPARLDVATVTPDRVEPFLIALRGEGMGFEPHEGQWFAVGGYQLRTIFGVGRVRTRDDVYLLDDVYVEPGSRRRGFASDLITVARRWAAQRATDLWLLADEDIVGFYERFGFVGMPPENFPAALAALCEAQGEWPSASDHVHIAMRAELSRVEPGTD